MLAAVQFYEQLFGQAGKVGNVRADGLLAAKSIAGQLLPAQVVPQESFCVGLILAQGLGALEGLGGVLAFDFCPAAWGVRGGVVPPPARLRAIALGLPTPPQGGSDLGGSVPPEGGFGMNGVEVYEPTLEERPRHFFEGFIHASVEFDLVVQGAEDVGDGALFRFGGTAP